MDFELTDEQRLIKRTAREFTDHEIVERARENARNHHFDLELVQKIADQGYLGAIVPAEYDDGGSIGKRYRRQDEIGTPFCVTIDHQSTDDETVTLRERDTLAQERVPIADVARLIEERVSAPWSTPKLMS